MRIVVTEGFRVGDRSRGRFATPSDFPLQYCSPYSHVHVTSRKCGIFPSFKNHFLSPVPNPNITIAFFPSLYASRQLVTAPPERQSS
jgi:hypothetical protein